MSQHIVVSNKTTTADGDQQWNEEEKVAEGTYRRLVVATPWVLERTHCFCCTCYEDYYSGMTSTDAYCRNHGIGFGERPCDIHNLPGSPIDREALGSNDDWRNGVVFIGPEPMPEPVSVVRARNKADRPKD